MTNETSSPERRSSPLSDQQLEDLADKVAERLAARTFETIGRSVVKDVAQGDPVMIYAPSIAALYTVMVPDGTMNGATLVNGSWVNPPPYVPPPPPPYVAPVPDNITNAQARYVLRRTPTATAGVTLFDAVDAAVAAQGGDIKQFWEYANLFYRQSPSILGLASALGLTSAQLDDLFRTASEVQL
jgi:hypothetical protein